MSKRNQVLFTKPEDPKFLKLIKQQAGYKDDGPNVDTKRAKFDDFSDDDGGHSDNDEERPQVVVIGSGDLTAEEAEREKQRLELENSTKPADLSERIVFKAKGKSAPSASSSVVVADTHANSGEPKADAPKPKKAKKSAQPKGSKLSFAFEDDEEDE